MFLLLIVAIILITLCASSACTYFYLLHNRNESVRRYFRIANDIPSYWQPNLKRVARKIRKQMEEEGTLWKP